MYNIIPYWVQVGEQEYTWNWEGLFSFQSAGTTFYIAYLLTKRTLGERLSLIPATCTQAFFLFCFFSPEYKVVRVWLQVYPGDISSHINRPLVLLYSKSIISFSEECHPDTLVNVYNISFWSDQFTLCVSKQCRKLFARYLC